MHSSDAIQPVAVGPALLLQLGRLIIRARSNSPSPTLTKHKQNPSTSQQVLIETQPKADEEDARLEANLSSHIQALWTEQIPVCVEVFLGPACSECYATMPRAEEPARPLRGLLLERWTMRAVLDKSESPSVISSPWLLNAVRSQLHFSQLSAWRARSQPRPLQRRRKLSRERCNFKKIEANLNSDEEESKLNIVYSIKTPGEKISEFATPPTDHTFPLTDIGNDKYLKVVLESLPRVEGIPEVRCACQMRRNSKDFSNTEELVGRLNDLSIGSRKYDGAINSNIGTPSRRLSIIYNPGSTEYLFTVKDRELLDDRMHTTCSENGKHKCNCDEESDSKDKNQAKELDEKRIKEIAKYKRRIRKEKLRRFCDSTSSDGEVKAKETTSIPILQASRFDRFRAIGCYRNQTYLTLPASRIETKSPFIETDSINPPVYKRTSSVSTQTDFTCSCGNSIEISHKCDGCQGMVRSEAIYDLASLQNGARRKLDDEDADKSMKKHKCDSSVSNCTDGFIKRPKLRRFFPIVDRLEKIVTDRDRNAEKDMQDLHLKTDDTVFSTANETKVLHPTSNGSNDFHPRTYDVNGSHPRTDEANGWHSNTDGSYSYDLHPRTEESNGFHPRTDDSNGFHPRTDDSNGFHPRTDDSNEFHPRTDDSNGIHPRTDDSNGFHPRTDDSNGFHPRTDDSNGFHPRTDESNGMNPRTDDQISTPKESKRQKTFSISDDDYVVYEKCDYGTIDRHEVESPKEENTDFKFSPPERSELDGQEKLECLKEAFIFPNPKRSEQAPSPSEMDRFRWRFDSAASMVFHAKTGLPLTSSPAPLRRGNSCFDFDDSINGISGIKSALFHPITPAIPSTPLTPVTPEPAPCPSTPKREGGKLRMGSSSGLLGSFEESALQGRLEAVATVQGFTAEVGASGAFCPPHKRFPVTVFFYAPGGTAAPYMGHIALGAGGYRVSRAGSVQVSLFNPHGTLVKMFVVLYDLTRMPPRARTFLRQRTLCLPPGAAPPRAAHRYLRYLIHLRFMTSKSGKLYLHTDIRVIVSRKADLDTATAHSALRPTAPLRPSPPQTGDERDKESRSPIRVFGGSSEHDSEPPEIGYENTNISCELRSFTYAPDNPKYSPR